MNVGVVGAGAMGAGIAQAFAQAEGFRVKLCDINEEFAAAGKERIQKNLQLAVSKGKMEPGKAEEILEKITTGIKEELCSDCELMIEAALEDIEVKKQTFKELDAICGPECIFASNTSSLSITEIGKGIHHPVVGMHFFNPAPVMKLVEIVEGLTTPQETVEAVRKISVSIGKKPIRAKEAAGFVVNRVLVPMINEAIGIYADGLASAEDIDDGLKFGANHPMGPLALGDMVGLDIILAVMEVLLRETGDSKYRPHELLRKMVRAGHLGVKTGKGFYEYKVG